MSVHQRWMEYFWQTIFIKICCFVNAEMFCVADILVSIKFLTGRYRSSRALWLLLTLPPFPPHTQSGKKGADMIHSIHNQLCMLVAENIAVLWPYLLHPYFRKASANGELSEYKDCSSASHSACIIWRPLYPLPSLHIHAGAQHNLIHSLFS